MKPARKCLLLIAGLILSACATVPLSEAETVAKSGQAATLAVQASLADLSTRASSRMEIVAFTTTLQNCVGLASCEPYKDTQDLAGAYRTYIGHVARRQAAVEALSTAYTALLNDAQTDSRTSLDRPVSALVTSVTDFAEPLVPGSTLIGELVRQGVAIQAQQSQQKRLRTANELIGTASALLAEALEAEAAYHDAIARDLDEVREEFRKQLVENDILIEPTPVERGQQDLMALSDAAGVAVDGQTVGSVLAADEANGERILTAIASARTIRETNRQALREAALRDRGTEYSQAIQTLYAMSAIHRSYGALRPSDYDALIFLMEELRRTRDTVDKIRSLEEAEE